MRPRGLPKQCITCGAMKPRGQFGLRSTSDHQKYKRQCLECEAAMKAARLARAAARTHRVCSRCRQSKPQTEEHYHRSKSLHWDRYCRPCRSEYQRSSASPDGPTRSQAEYAERRSAEARSRDARRAAIERISVLARGYVAVREITRGPEYRSAHDALEAALRDIAPKSVEVDGRVWRWSNMAGGIVSEPIRREWRKSEGPAPDRYYRIDAPGVPSLCGRDSPLEMGLAETLA